VSAARPPRPDLLAWLNEWEKSSGSASRRILICCGFALANKGHDTRSLQKYLGHKNIQHTVRYTELSPDRFKDFWR
jgi:integrase